MVSEQPSVVGGGGVTEDQKMNLEKRRLAAGRALQAHFGSQPDGVIVVSVSQGMIKADVTEFGSIGEMLFASELVRKYVTESFENSLIAARKVKEPEAHA